MSKHMSYRVLIGMLGVVLFTSCYEDKGNYDYTPVENVYIGEMASKYTLGFGDTLKINPKCISLVDTTEIAGWDCLWKISQGKVIGNQLNLSYVTDTIGNFTAFLQITNPQTGLSYVKEFLLNITSPYNMGWMILSKRPDKTVLDFVSPETREIEGVKQQVYKLRENVYEKENPGEILEGEPVGICEHWLGNGDGAEVMLMLNGGKGSLELNGENMIREVYTRDEFLNADWPSADFKIRDAWHGNWGSYIVSEKGELYARKNISNAAFQAGSILNVPVYYTKGLDVTTIIPCNSYESGFLLIFDQANNRFLGINDDSRSAGKISELAPKGNWPSGYFPLNGLGEDRKLVHAEFFDCDYYGVSVCCFIEDTDGHIYVQEFRTDDVLATWDMKKYEIPGGMLNKDSQISVLSRLPYLFFSGGAEGKELFCFDRSHLSQEPVRLTTFPDKISSVAYNYGKSGYYNTNTEVAVGTEGGEFKVLKISDGIWSGSPEWIFSASDLGAIREIQYKLNSRIWWNEY